MNNRTQTKSRAVRTRKKVRRYIHKHSGGVRIVAVFLATVMAFSALSANVSSIVKLMDVQALAPGEETGGQYYSAKLTLYDYYQTENGNLFNQVLDKIGYAANAGEYNDSTFKYYPLYLGKNMSPGNGRSNFSNPANSEAGTATYNNSGALTGGNSAAAQGLIDSTLYGEVPTQGNAAVRLPYFDEDFLTAPIRTMVNPTSVGLSSGSNETLGKVESGYNFKFRYNDTTKLYEYISKDGSYTNVKGDTVNDSGTGLVYDADSMTFVVQSSIDSTNAYKDSKGAYGFFPWKYINNGAPNNTTVDVNDYYYAAKFEMDFSMTENGCLPGTTTGMEFNFKGDDDVWVFIDDHLVLDVGGAHGAVAGSIYFDKSGGSTPYSRTQYVKANLNTTGNTTAAVGTEQDLQTLMGNDDFNAFYGDASTNHKLTVFYIERGWYESNCKISFNFQVPDVVSVVNTLDMSDVNDKFRTATKAVADTEAVAYEIQSNSEQAAVNSPDVGTIDHNAGFSSTPNSSQYVYASFDVDGDGESDDATYAPIKVRKGKSVKLPDGFKIVNGVYKVSSWKVGGTDVGIGTYTMNSDTLFTAVLSPMTKAEFEAWYPYPSAPTLIEVKNVTGLGDLKNADKLEPYYVSSDKNLINITTNHSNTSSELYFDQPERIPGYNSNGNNYSGARDGNFQLNGNDGQLYLLDKSTKTLSVIDVSTPSNYTASNYKTWIEKYYDLYSALKTARDRIYDHYAAGVDVTSELATYQDYISQYYQKVPSGTSDNGSSLTTLKDNLLNAIPEAPYVYTNEYDSDMVTFYVYSSSAPTVTITNASTYGLDSNDGVTISGPNAAPTTPYTGYTDSKYYTVTVKKNIVRTGTATGYPDDVQNIGCELSITADGDTSTITAAEIATAIDGGKTYYCFYPTEGWRDIEDSPITYEYSTNYKVFWVYDESGTAPTVTYGSSIAGSGLTSENATLVESVSENSGVKYYYGYKVPAYVNTINGGATTEQTPVQLTIVCNNGSSQTKTVSLDNRIINSEPYCYYYGCSNLADGCYKLVTMCFNDRTPGTGSYVYAWYNDTDFPTSSDTWDAKRLEMTRFGNDYRYYMPSVSGIKFKIYDSSPSGEYSLQLEDYFYSENGNITSSNNPYFYPYTATSKATSLLANSGSGSPSSGGAEPMNLTPRRSGGNNGSGQFVNDGDTGSYDTADGVNFKLYNSDAPGDASAESVVRQTGTTGDEAGKFYMHFGQSAKFTYQFRRATGMRIAQTGDSAFYDDMDEVLPSYLGANATPKGVMYDAEANENEGNASSGLFNRYSTSWELTDTIGNKITSGYDGYNVYNKGGNSVTFVGKDANYTAMSTAFNNATYYDAGAIYFQDIAVNAGERAKLNLTAEFTNSVNTGSLYIKKVLDDDALTEIANYCRDNPPLEVDYKAGLAFGFSASFSEIFGGSGSLSNYDGAFYIVDAGNPSHYYNADGNWYTRVVKSNGTVKYMLEGSGEEISAADAGVVSPGGSMKLYYADACKANGDPVETGGTVKMIKIEGIPVETKYTVNETIVSTTNNSGEPVLELSASVYYKANDSASNLNASSTAQIIPVLGSATAEDNDVIATYYPIVSGTYDGADAKIVVTNSPITYYIVVRKTIDKSYYFTEKNNDKTDNPAGLYNTTAKVGGAAGNDDSDANGYQEATGAEQSFIFKIEEFDTANASGTALNTFTEALSFTAAGTKEFLIKVNPSHSYKVTEDTGWSWKYTLTGSSLNGTSKGTADVSVRKYSNSTNDYAPYGSLQHCAIVAYTDKRQPTEGSDLTKHNVEGDTSIAENLAEVS